MHRSSVLYAVVLLATAATVRAEEPAMAAPADNLQARAVASHIRKGGGRMRAMKQGQRPDLSGGIRYLSSERHRYEVEHSSYARQLRKVIRLLEA